MGQGLKVFYKRADLAVERGLKSFTRMVFPRNPWRIFSLPRTAVDYLKDVGDGTGSSTVTAPLYWVARTFPEAPPALWQSMENSGQEEQVRDHPLLRLLERPNDFYTGMKLWMATVIDYQVDGNAYWLKRRNGAGRVMELWWVPHWLMFPKDNENDASIFIDHYEYRPGTKVIKIEPADVVHFRFGLDGDDPRLGRSPLKSVLREVYTDDEAAAFTASLLGNMGVPGLIVSPAKGVSISEEEAKDAKQHLMSQFTGDRRGEPLVQTGATEVQQFGFSPEQLLLRELRRIPEERVTAVMGIPAIVAGLGAGLDRSTFTNMKEAREAAYEAGIIPMQRNLGEDVRFQLLSDFEPNIFKWRFGFDLSHVRVLQEDRHRQAQRHDLAVRGGWELVAEARRALGLEVDEARDNVFIRQSNTVTVPTDGSPLVLNGNGNGSSNGAAGDLARELARELATQT